MRIALDTQPKKRREAIAASARMRPDYLVAPFLMGEDLATLLEQVTRGTQGVIMCATSATLRQAVARMSTDLATARSSIGSHVAREWIHAAFDIALEVTRLRDGRLRVVRLAEFRQSSSGHNSLRDIFTFAYHRTAAGGSVEGAFYASGTVPRVVEDIAARGMPLDTSIFRRQHSS
jgi:pilus assembly protein CpaF